MSVVQYFVPFTPYPYKGEEIVCDLCGCSDYEVICENDRRFKKLRTVACTSCGLMRTNPMPTEAEINEYYSSIYRLDYGPISSKPTRRHLNRSHRKAANRMEVLAPALKPGAQILDFGCGAGVFLSHAKNVGFETLGIEPGIAFAKFASDEFGLDIINDIWENVELARQFDVITAVEVLEHLRHPVDAMRWLRDNLAEDGIVYITVPNMLLGNIPTFPFRASLSFFPAKTERHASAHLLSDAGRSLCSGRALGYCSGHPDGSSGRVAVKIAQSRMLLAQIFRNWIWLRNAWVDYRI